jgi:hypothetical protein
MSNHAEVVWHKKLNGLSPQANYTDRDLRLSAKLVPTFADRGCHVVSVISIRPYITIKCKSPVLSINYRQGTRNQLLMSHRKRDSTYFNYCSGQVMLGGFLVATTWCVLGLWMEEGPPSYLC